MARKWLLTGSAIAVGVTMLVTGVFAQANSQSGYEVLKEVLKNKSAHQNFTGNLSLKVTDNDSILLEGTGLIKADHKSDTMSGKLNFTAQGMVKKADIYEKDNQTVVKSSDSDVFKVIEHKDGFKKHREDVQENSEEFAKLHDAITDALVGDLKNQVKAEANMDGSQKITLDLNESQIPDTANTIIALAIKHKPEMKKDENCELFDCKDSFKHPELVKDIVIEAFKLEVLVDANKNVKSASTSIEIKGNDKDSVKHDIKIDANLDVSDIGSTAPDTINLDGKKVEKIDRKNCR